MRKTKQTLATVILLVNAGSVVSAQTVPTSRSAKVTIDFSKSRGAFLHPERFNNLSRANRWAEQRDADVQFFNATGLHGQTYKVWVDAQTVYDGSTGAYNYAPVRDYLADASRLADNLLMVMDTRVQIRDGKATPAEIKPIIKRIMLDLKKEFPQIRYIEAFNEPDHNLAKVLSPSALYDYYVVYYQAVNEINKELRPTVPLEIGGPAFMQYNGEWIPAFLDRFKADPSPGKRLDFFSWHGYGMFPPGTGDKAGPRAYHFFKSDPSEVASERKRFEQELAKRGLDTRIPSFITETGIYPGPSFDHATDPKPDYLIGAAGVPALHYWYMESPRNFPFNWVLRHSTEERKDQLVTRAGEGKAIPTNIFTPYGNAMAMMAKLKADRVDARSSALAAGKGVYVIATQDKSGAAVMVWNYQHISKQPYRVTIDMGQLPPSLCGKTLHQRMWRIDDKLSNYWAEPAKANLQQVSDSTVLAGQRHSVTVDLSPNALQLVVLEAVK